MGREERDEEVGACSDLESKTVRLVSPTGHEKRLGYMNFKVLSYVI